MGVTTGIAWCDHTFNAWWGCDEVSPGCDNCYAKAWDKRLGGNHWGPHAPRRTFGEKHWAEPLKWDRAAAKAGVRRRVFVNSMADVFDPKGPDSEREKLWDLIATTPNLDWLLLTKRPQLAKRYVPWMYSVTKHAPYENVWIGTTVEDQERAELRIPHLLAIPAAVRFLSVEPLLGPVDLGPWFPPRGPAVVGRPDLALLDWVIVGGESGGGSRPCNVEWVRSVMEQCRAAGVATFVKQLGAVPQVNLVALKLKHKKGAEPLEWPEDLRIQDFPRGM